MPLKALTLTQPWATLVAIGAKRIETRSWRPTYRGPLAIHAAKRFPGEARALCRNNPFHAALHSAGYASETYSGDLPLGFVIATCNLVECVPAAYVAGSMAGYQKPIFTLHPELDTEEERAFGDYSTGRFAWILEDVQPLPEPIPAKGKLGLWEWEGPEMSA